MTKNLKIIDAYTNNLKHISLELPHNSVNVIIGKSGAGKSSLAYDTIYNESERKYIQTFSSYTRQFFNTAKKSSVEDIENIRPAIAIKQRTKIKNSRSTVGSLSHANDYLRIFFANFCDTHCPVCGRKLEFFLASMLAKKLIADFNSDGSKDNDKEINKDTSKDSSKDASKESNNPTQKPSEYFLLIAPIKINKKKDTHSFIKELTAQGFTKFFDTKTNGIYSDNEKIILDENNKIYLIVDRFINFTSTKEKRLVESINQCYKLSLGFCNVLKISKDKVVYNKVFSLEPTCECIDFKIQAPLPAFFSSNHPLGACDECKGFGNLLSIDLSLAINENLSIKDGAISIFEMPSTLVLKDLLIKFCKKENIDIDAPFKDLQKEERDKIIYVREKGFCGVMPFFDDIKRRTYKMHVRVFLSRYQKETTCPKCGGTKLKKISSCYKINNMTYSDLQNLEIKELYDFISNFSKSQKNLKLEQKEIIKQIVSRLEILITLSLSYLTLDRQAKTLSSGETQRVNLTTAIGSPLSNTHFILDEPSCGLHSSDTKNLIKAIYDLKNKNNTVTVLEHDPLIIAAAEHLTELGPGGGERGGSVIFNGKSSDWDYKELESAINERPRLKIKPTKFLKIKNANARNLKNIDVSIGLNALNALSGVSGSGKSTLATKVLLESFENYKKDYKKDYKKNAQKTFEKGCKKIEGFENFSDVLYVDQTPIIKSPRANIATYTKIWDEIRTIFSNTDYAKQNNIGKSSFSFNVDGGRCKECKGMGYLKEDMQFLEDVYITCPVCLGKRFKDKILKVAYKGKNINDILNMSLENAKEFFKDNEKISNAVFFLEKLGLSYLTLGESLSELSGGEAQRLKLVPYITKAKTSASKTSESKNSESKNKNILFIFDEPTSGLYPTDINNLIILFDTLIKEGHTILLIEHNEQMLNAADYIIELGTSGGANGGKLIYNGLNEDKHGKEKFEFKSLNNSFLKRASKLSKNEIIIKNATEHNLKNISLNIPLNKMISLVGVSGSGKSTLAKNIIYAEGTEEFL